MNRKLISIILFIFFILSNISFSLTNFYSFLMEKKSLNCLNIVDVQQQYNMLINVPKEFVNICVKVCYDIKLLANLESKKQYIFADNYNFNQKPIALIYSITKLKTIKNFAKYKNLLFNFMTKLIKISIVSILIFYLLCYIGLLRLFGSMSLLLSFINRIKNSVYCRI